MKFSIKDFFRKCDQIRRKLDLATFTEEILNGKRHFLCSTTIAALSSIFLSAIWLSHDQLRGTVEGADVQHCALLISIRKLLGAS